MSKKEEDKMLKVSDDQKAPEIDTLPEDGQWLKEKKPKAVHAIQKAKIMEAAFKRLAAVALSPQQFREFQESFPEIFE